MATDFTRFEITRKGYDPLAVERELKDLTSELLRLTEQNSELQDRLRATTAQLAQSEAALEASKSPNFASLGAKAATILSSAQQIAAELEIDANQVASNLLSEAKAEAAKLKLAAQQHYDAVVEDASRRAQRTINAAEQDAERIVAKAQNEAKRILAEVELAAARTRGQVATEVAALRATTKRELAAKQAEQDATAKAKLAQLLEGQLSGEEALTEAAQARLDAGLELRRSEAEQLYLEKHREAVLETENYLSLASQDMAGMTQRVAELRFEIETLELEASVTQKRIIQEARDKAEAVIASAEAAAREQLAQAKLNAESETSAARSEVTRLQNQAAAIEIYLENLRSLVTGELSRRTDGTAHQVN